MLRPDFRPSGQGAIAFVPADCSMIRPRYLGASDEAGSNGADSDRAGSFWQWVDRNHRARA
jgi:hypothetical protein